MTESFNLEKYKAALFNPIVTSPEQHLDHAALKALIARNVLSIQQIHFNDPGYTSFIQGIHEMENKLHSSLDVVDAAIVEELINFRIELSELMWGLYSSYTNINGHVYNLNNPSPVFDVYRFRHQSSYPKVYAEYLAWVIKFLQDVYDRTSDILEAHGRPVLRDRKPSSLLTRPNTGKYLELAIYFDYDLKSKKEEAMPLHQIFIPKDRDGLYRYLELRCSKILHLHSLNFRINQDLKIIRTHGDLKTVTLLQKFNPHHKFYEELMEFFNTLTKINEDSHHVIVRTYHQ